MRDRKTYPRDYMRTERIEVRTFRKGCNQGEIIERGHQELQVYNLINHPAPQEHGCFSREIVPQNFTIAIYRGREFVVSHRDNGLNDSGKQITVPYELTVPRCPHCEQPLPEKA